MAEIWRKVLAVAVLALLPNFIRADDAPSSLAGKTAVVVISDGGGVFAQIGGYRLAFSPTSNTYTVAPLSWNLVPSAGTYTYVKTGPSTGTLTIKDTAVGTQVGLAMVFTSPTTAAYTVGTGANFQSGTAVWENVQFNSTGDRLYALSVRSWVRKGGFAIPGFALDKTTKVLIRASGPGLGDFGVSPVLANPNFELVRQSDSVTLATNDDWSADPTNKFEVEAAAAAAGAFAFKSGSKDAAVVKVLEPGAYTAVIRGGASDEGEILLEVYRVP
jgi:hypothetical protein